MYFATIITLTMKKIITLIAYFTLTLVAYTQNVVYVDSRATGTNNGTSWANAFTKLTDAVTAAPANAEIWVAYWNFDGYKTTKTGLRTESIVIDKPIKIYGGFSGSETSKSARNATGNTSINGELGNPSVVNDNAIQAFVIKTKGIVIDRFEFMYYSAWLADNSASGIILADTNSSVSITNCTFRNNEGGGRGLIATAYKGSQVVIDNLTANNNSKENYSSLIVRFDDAKIKVNNSNFSSNGKNSYDGYVFYSYRSSTVGDSTFNNQLLLDVTNSNFAANNMAVSYNYFGSESFYNCQIVVAGSAQNTFNTSSKKGFLKLKKCDFTGSYGSYLVYTSSLKSFEFQDITISNPANNNQTFVNASSCDTVTMTNCVFNNLSGSYPVQVFSDTAGLIKFKNITFNGGNPSSYMFYLVGKTIHIDGLNFLNVNAYLGNYITAKTVNIINSRFENYKNGWAVLTTNYVDNMTYKNCIFKNITQLESLFRNDRSNSKIIIENCTVDSLTMGNVNPGRAILLHSFTDVTCVNNTFKNIRSSGYLINNWGTMNIFGNIFKDIKNDQYPHIHNMKNLYVYNSNFADNNAILFQNDSSYGNKDTVDFKLINSIVYSQRDTLVWNNSNAKSFTQTVSNCVTNKFLIGSNNKNNSSIPYNDFYLTTTSINLQNLGTNLSLSFLPTKDILGKPRVMHNFIDIGAIEFQDVINEIQDVVAENSLHFNCYPNPASDILEINTTENFTIQIHNSKGMKINSFYLEKGIHKIDFSEYPKGMYYIKADSGLDSKTIKLIKE